MGGDQTFRDNFSTFQLIHLLEKLFSSRRAIWRAYGVSEETLDWRTSIGRVQSLCSKCVVLEPSLHWVLFKYIFNFQLTVATASRIYFRFLKYPLAQTRWLSKSRFLSQLPLFSPSFLAFAISVVGRIGLRLNTSFREERKACSISSHPGQVVHPGCSLPKAAGC